MYSKTVEVGVGLFVALGLAALLMLAMKVSNLAELTGPDGYHLTARFDNIGGLKVRAPVKSAGVVVGRVSQILFDDKTYQATVVIDMDQRYQFPKDSSAKILTSGLLGEQYVGLEPGGDSAMLAGGSKITMTQSAVVLENLISQFLYSKAADAGAGGNGGGSGAAKPAEGSGSK